jgi:hypothetical protein
MRTRCGCSPPSGCGPLNPKRGGRFLGPNLGDFVNLRLPLVGGEAKPKFGGRCKARPEVLEFTGFYRPFKRHTEAIS